MVAKVIFAEFSLANLAMNFEIKLRETQRNCSIVKLNS